MQPLRHRAAVLASPVFVSAVSMSAVFVSWAASAFGLYLCFISTVDGPELVAGAVTALAAGALATVALTRAERGLLTAGRRWYAPAAVWLVDVATDCVLLGRLMVRRAPRTPTGFGEIRTLRLRGGIPPAVAGFWLSSTPGGCVVGTEGRTLTVHSLSGKPSRVERVLTVPGEAG